jgi:hypothetical protein
MAERNELLDWRISSRSSGGSCVEVAIDPARALMRHSRDPDGSVLVFGQLAFREFIAGVRSGEFDLPE